MFTGLISNEFAYQEMECEPPYLVPQVPNAQPQYQGCTLRGSQPGRSTVSGADYIQTSFSYSRAHLWRNFGFLWAFFIFFVFLTALGFELMKPNTGGGAITMFKRGQVPKRVEESIATGGREKNNSDEESGRATTAIDAHKMADEKEKSEPMKEVATNESIFTFQNINYTIPFEKGQRKLLQDVDGYVRPGKLTALMGASGTFCICSIIPMYLHLCKNERALKQLFTNNS